MRVTGGHASVTLFNSRFLGSVAFSCCPVGSLPQEVWLLWDLILGSLVGNWPILPDWCELGRRDQEWPCHCSEEKDSGAWKGSCPGTSTSFGSHRLFHLGHCRLRLCRASCRTDHLTLIAKVTRVALEPPFHFSLEARLVSYRP